MWQLGRNLLGCHAAALHATASSQQLEALAHAKAKRTAGSTPGVNIWHLSSSPLSQLHCQLCMDVRILWILAGQVLQVLPLHESAGACLLQQWQHLR